MKWLNNLPLNQMLGSSTTWLIELALCGTILMVLVLVAGWLLRNRNATTKHAFYTTGLIGLLTLPAFLLALPHWTVPTAAVRRMVIHATASQDADATQPAVTDIWQTRATGQLDSHIDQVQQHHVDHSAMHAPFAAPGKNLTQHRSETFEIAEQSIATSRSISRDWGAVLIAVWLMGVAICLLRLVASAMWLRSLPIKRLMPDECANTLSTWACVQMTHQRATVSLVDREIMPMAVGIWRKQILLPKSALALDPNVRDAIVKHELGHLSRQDPLWHLLAELSRALFWFHPLQWMIVHACAVTREQACDDLVLRGGFAPDLYARGLLHAVARYRGSSGQCVGVAMAASNHIENRIRNVMNPARDRHSLSRSSALAIAAVVFSSCIALSIVRAADTPVATAVEKPVAEQKQPDTAPQTAPKSAENPPPAIENAAAVSDALTLSGRILNSQGEPVADAKIETRWFDSGSVQTLEKTTNQLGEFSITYPAPKDILSFRSTWISGGENPIETLAFSPSFGGSQAISHADIHLRKGDPVTVRVVTPDGLPLKGALVYPHAIQLNRMHQGPAGPMVKDASVVWSALPESWIDSLSVPTNQNGEATLTNFPDRTFEQVIVSSAEYGQQHFAIPKANGDLRLSPVGSIRGKVIYDHLDQIAGERVYVREIGDSAGSGIGQAEVELNERGEFFIPAFAVGHAYLMMHWDDQLPMHPMRDRNLWIKENEVLAVTISTVPAVKVRGQVLTSDTQQPVANARITLNCLDSALNGSRTKSDADGRFELYVAPGKAIRQVISMGTELSLYENYDYPRLDNLIIPEESEFTLPNFYLTPKQVINGLVRDSAGNPIAGKSIAYHDDTTRISATTTTGPDGRFTTKARDWNLIQSTPRITKRYHWSIVTNPQENLADDSLRQADAQYDRLNVLRNLPGDMLLELP